MKLIKRGILCFIVAGLSVAVVYKIAKVNQDYPEKKIVYVSAGSCAKIGSDDNGIQVKVKDCNWLSGEEVVQAYGKISEVPDDVESKTAMVKISLENNNNEEERIELYRFYIECLGYCNGVSPEIFQRCNGCDMIISLNAGEEKELVLPYTVYESQFRSKEWNELELKEFYLVNERYPEKKCWYIC